MNHEFSETEFTLEGQALMDASLLDQMKHISELYAAHLANPSEANSVLLTDILNTHLDTVKLVFEKLDDKSNSTQNIDELIAYARGLEINRVATLNSLHLPKDDSEDAIYEVAEEELDYLREYLTDEDREDEYEDDLSIAEHMYNFYAASLQADVRYFATKNATDYHNRPEVKRKEKLKKLGARALDIGIASAGAFIAMSIVNKFKKK